MSRSMTLDAPLTLALTGAAPARPRSFFQPIDADQSEAVLEEYVRFIHRRNGEADFERFTFSKREAHMAELHATRVRFEGRFDGSLFRRQLRRYDRSVETPWVEKLLLVLCKMNAAEEYAVDVMRETRKRHQERSDARAFIEKVALTEEEYHTRLLLGCGQYFGVEVDEEPDVRRMLRLKIHALANVPGLVFNSVILAAEGVGLYTLYAVLQAARKILADQPDVRDAVEERIFNVMIDEIGHVTFNRHASGPLGVAFARALYPVVTHAFSIGREYEELCAYVDDLVPARAFDFGHLPEEVRSRGFFA